MEWNLKKTGNPEVDRSHLNKILKEIRAALDEVLEALAELEAGSGNGGGTGADGAPGADGAQGPPGADGEDGFPTFTGTAGEALAAGDFVSVDAAGEIVKADASTNDLLAVGFVLTAFTLGATDVLVFMNGDNTSLSGLTVGDQYYLSDTVPGGVVATPPTGNSPVVIQQLGTASSATTIMVNIQQAIELPA